MYTNVTRRHIQLGKEQKHTYNHIHDQVGCYTKESLSRKKVNNQINIFLTSKIQNLDYPINNTQQNPPKNMSINNNITRGLTPLTWGGGGQFHFRMSKT